MSTPGKIYITTGKVALRNHLRDGVSLGYKIFLTYSDDMGGTY